MQSAAHVHQDNREKPKAEEDRSPPLKPMKTNRRVMICCVTFETVKVIQPIEYVGAEKVYMLHWSRPGTVYCKFYDEVVRELKEKGLSQLVDVNVEVYRFNNVLEKLISIMVEEREDGNDVYINISAGTMEFAAAATIASMMVEGVKPFTVHVKEYTIAGDEAIRQAFFIDSKPVGQAKAVFDPVQLPTFPIDMPPRDLVVGLRILRGRKEGKKNTKYGEMIKALTDAGVWDYKPERPKKDLEQAKKMYYSRHFIDGWIRQGWVNGKDGRGKQLGITESGKNVIEVFYRD